MTTILSLPPANKRIEYYRNDEFARSIIVYDQDGVPVDLSGKNLVMQVKVNKSDYSTKSVAVLSSGNGITVSGANNNIITFSGKYDIEEGSYFYDLENTTDSLTLMYGEFVVTGDVTRL